MKPICESWLRFFCENLQLGRKLISLNPLPCKGNRLAFLHWINCHEQNFHKLERPLSRAAWLGRVNGNELGFGVYAELSLNSETGYPVSESVEEPKLIAAR